MPWVIQAAIGGWGTAAAEGAPAIGAMARNTSLIWQPIVWDMMPP